MPRVAIQFSGVDYLHGHREETAEVLDTLQEPSASAAEGVLRDYLSKLGDIRARIRAGWAAVRWLDDAQPAWRGPAWLFAFQAPTASEFELELTGEDESDWPPPEIA